MPPTIDPHGLVPVWERLLVADVGRNPLRMLMRRFANKFCIGDQKRTSTAASRKARAQPLCFVTHYITNHSLSLQVGICDDWASLHTIGVCHVRLSQTTKNIMLEQRYIPSASCTMAWSSLLDNTTRTHCKSHSCNFVFYI
jgi:hypothetical protein